PVCVLTPFRSSLVPEMRLQRAVGIYRAFDSEKLRLTPSCFAFSTIFPFPTAWVVKLVPNPCTTNGTSN
ncbi:hypothetical protein C8F04DRAFT_926735, partial [Mycena alexandri]